MVTELPPNPQGIAALQMLNILETFNLSAMGHNTADYLHAHIEAKKLAFADRAKFYGDPDFGEPTPELIEWLVSKAYGQERAQLIDMGRAAMKVPAGTPPSPGSWAAQRTTARAQDAPHTGDTMYLLRHISIRAGTLDWLRFTYDLESRPAY
jgi:gamma-glutamyltranspeptidase